MQINKSTIDPIYNFDNYFFELKHNLQIAHQAAQHLLNNAKIHSKSQFDKNSNPKIYDIGDLVLVKNESGHKLDSLYLGPFKVIEIGDFNVTIMTNGQKNQIHKNRIVKYIS